MEKKDREGKRKRDPACERSLEGRGLVVVDSGGGGGGGSGGGGGGGGGGGVREVQTGLA